VVNSVTSIPCVYESFDAVFQVSNIEVYEKSEGSSTEFQVGNDLRLMNGSNRVHRFQFDDDQIFHQEIDSVAEIQLNAIVNHGQANLRIRLESGFLSSCCKHAVYVLSKSPGPSSE